MEYEDFLPNVRKSLYKKTQLDTKSKQNNNRKTKKIKFTPNHNDRDDIHNNSDLEFHNWKSEKLKNRKPTPFKRKFKNSPLLRERADSSSQRQQKLKKNVLEHVKRKKPKKRQVVISFTSSSDTFDEELKDVQITPSKSELETFQNTIDKSSKRKLCDTSDSNSEDDESESESGDNFDLETYFNTREISELNESIAEAHSGIEHEFVSDYAKDVTIMESESLCDQQSAHNNQIEDKEENDRDSEEDTVLKLKYDQKISCIADKIQESMVISNDTDDNGKESHEESNQLQEEKVVTDFSTTEIYDVEDKKIVVLKENQTVSFHGLFTLKVLHGKTEVLGGILDGSSDAVNLYSPRGSGLLYIKNVTPGDATQEQINISQLVPITKGSTKLNISIDSNSAAFLCSKLLDSGLLFLEKYVSQKIFPRPENNNIPQVVFEPTGNFNKLKKSSQWDEILNGVNRGTKLMIAGGKGVGKSTLLRFAINRLLNKFEKVKVLDLDPGQSEFAVPGCVSIVTIKEPIFGPNFTHLKQTDRSLLSNINVAHDPRAYLRCIRSIVSYLETLQGNYPILINYMGFSQGIGLNIISSAIKCIQPTDIVQIYSKNRNKNFKVDLTYDAVEENRKLFSDEDKPHLNYSELKYKLHKVLAMNDESDGWSLEPRQSREMYVLAYFGQMMRNGVNSLTSHKLSMYEIKLSAIKIANLQGEEIVPAVINANLVALCSLDQESNIFTCVGYGVIRGVDLENDKLVVITPEQATVLEDVHYLVMGSVFLPPAVYMTPDDVRGAVPYVMEGELVSLGQITKRSYVPANKK